MERPVEPVPDKRASAGIEETVQSDVGPDADILAPAGLDRSSTRASVRPLAPPSCPLLGFPSVRGPGADASAGRSHYLATYAPTEANCNMKLALYVPTLTGGGAERTWVTLANALADRGYLVDLVVAQSRGPLRSEVSPKVRLIDLSCNHKWLVPIRLAKYIRKSKPTTVLAASNQASLVAVCAKFLLMGQVKVIVSIHGTLSLTPALQVGGLRARLQLRIWRILFSCADAVVAVSNGVAHDFSQLTRIPHERVKVIYNPVISRRMFELAQEEPEVSWPFQDGVPVVLGVGRLVKSKDFATLIRAFAKVRVRKPARLVILGEGPERVALEALIQQLHLRAHVVLPGFVSNPYPYMKRASVFVLSSIREGLGNVLIEALALGAPVIATECPHGPAEILQGGRLGRLVPVGDSDALAEAIMASLDNATMPAKANLACFTVDRAVRQYQELLGDVAL